MDFEKIIYTLYAEQDKPPCELFKKFCDKRIAPIYKLDWDEGCAIEEELINLCAAREYDAFKTGAITAINFLMGGCKLLQTKAGAIRD